MKFGENDFCKITSYINILHPAKHEPLYDAIEKIIAKAIPMWDKTLSSTERTQRPVRIDIDEAEWIEGEAEREPEPDESELCEDEIMKLDETFRRQERKLVMPELGSYNNRKNYKDASDHITKDVGLRKDWAKEGVQIIVKLASIHLTPEKPAYDGGSWHIEGQLNDHICASALYYYDSSNITPSTLSFREATRVEHLSDKPYEQDDHDHFELLYDIQQNGPAIQTLGSVATPENRLITFPNVLQHSVSPFSLADKTQPGHRKILALFLVDPYTRIPSSKHFPP